MKLVSSTNSTLATPALTVGQINTRIKTIVDQMEKLLCAQKNPPGVGLAAPQVGIARRIFLMKKDDTSPTFVFINPIILERTAPEKKPKTKKESDQKQLEGCLSLPRIWARVTRDEKVLVEYQTIDGLSHTKWFEGFEAVIIQHEIDHLDGVLFTKRALEQSHTIYHEEDGTLTPTKI